MTSDEIVESIRSICAPLPEARNLCDTVVEAVEERLEAYTDAARYYEDATRPDLHPKDQDAAWTSLGELLTEYAGYERRAANSQKDAA